MDDKIHLCTSVTKFLMSLVADTSSLWLASTALTCSASLSLLLMPRQEIKKQTSSLLIVSTGCPPATAGAAGAPRAPPEFWQKLPSTVTCVSFPSLWAMAYTANLFTPCTQLRPTCMAVSTLRLLSCRPIISSILRCSSRKTSFMADWPWVILNQTKKSRNSSPSFQSPQVKQQEKALYDSMSTAQLL